MSKPFSRTFPLLSALLLNFVLACSFSLWAFEEETESTDADAADKPVAASQEGVQAMAGFKKPEGWSVSLFAAEPAFANPVALNVDNRGRLFICETFRQNRGVTDNRAHDKEWLMADLSAQTVQDRIDYHHRLLGTEAAEYTAHDDRIRMLEDTDSDGVADKMTVFAEGFDHIEEGTGAGVLVRGNKAYYTCIPKLWSLVDEDGDGKSDTREALHDGYGVRVAFRGHDSHGLVIGPDGRLYFSIGDRGYNIETVDAKFKNVESGAVFRCELDGSNLEVFATGLRNPQELAFDDYGYLFTGDNNSDSGDKARWVNVMEGGDTGWRMMYQYLPDRGPFNREKIWEPYNKDVTPAYIVPPIANIGDGPSGLACYPGTGLSGDYANCFFMVDFRGGAANSGVRLIRTQPKGAFWEIERSEQPLWNILATDFEFGPDGRMWVCDWVEGWVGEGKGRVYRFEDDEAQKQDVVREVQQMLFEGFEDKTDEELAELLTHLDRRIRNESQWELANRGAVTALSGLLRDRSKGTIARLHAIWGIGQSCRLSSETREQANEPFAIALADQDLDVRAAAMSIVGDLRLKRFSDKVLAGIADVEPRVQYAACLAAGKLGLDEAVKPVCQMLQENANQDPGLRHAGIMALKGAGDISALQQHDSEYVRLAAVVALRKLADESVAGYLSDESTQVKLEAARAIHDVPALHGSLAKLASLSISSDIPDALVHRVINANFRLGGAEAAKLIASVAGNATASEMMRLEALDMLQKWADPGKLDRVMNRFMPLESRSATPASVAVKAILPDLLNGSNEIISKSIEVATELQLQESANTFGAYAQDTARPASIRTNAILAVVKLTGSDATALVQKLVQDNDALVRAAALRELSSLDAESAVPCLQTAIKSTDFREAQSAWDTLGSLSRKDASALVRQGVEDYLAGDLRPEVWLNVVEASEGKLGDSLQARLAEAQTANAEKSPVEAYRDCELGGDAEAGRTLFFEKTELSCVRCHKIADSGGEVGPDLSNIAKDKDSRYLLEAIVHPDAKIAEKFGTVILLTEDDEILTGILRSETEDEIELIDAEGKITKIEADLVIHRKAGKSAMPADLVKQMTRRELRDIVAYLNQLK